MYDVIWFSIFRTPAERFKFITIRARSERCKQLNIITTVVHVYLHVCCCCCFFCLHFFLFFLCHFDRLYWRFDYHRLCLLLIFKCGDLLQLDLVCCCVCVCVLCAAQSYQNFSIKVTQDLCHQFNAYISV